MAAAWTNPDAMPTMELWALCSTHPGHAVESELGDIISKHVRQSKYHPRHLISVLAGDRDPWVGYLHSVTILGKVKPAAVVAAVCVWNGRVGADLIEVHRTHR